MQSACFYPEDPSFLLTWENYAFAKDNNYFKIDTSGRTDIPDTDFVEKMKSVKSILNLWKIQEGFGFKRVDTVQFQGKSMKRDLK